MPTGHCLEKVEEKLPLANKKLSSTNAKWIRLDLTLIVKVKLLRVLSMDEAHCGSQIRKMRNAVIFQQEFFQPIKCLLRAKKLSAEWRIRTCMSIDEFF